MNKMTIDQSLNVVQLEYLDNKSKNFLNAKSTQSEFSVLAGIWATTGEKETKLLCLTTGVKCVPDKKLQKVQGLVIHDAHAEILAIRSLNFLMLDYVQQVKNGKSNFILEQDLDSKLFKLKDNVKLHMYVSELPCGDSSLDGFINDDSTPWSDEDVNSTTAIRGRSNYTQVGKVRTKPGRSDSPISLSKSCSDKLALLTVKGILNCYVEDLFASQIYLTSIVLPNITPSVTRCFRERFPLQFQDLIKTEIVCSGSEKLFEACLKDSNLGLLRRPTGSERAKELGIVYIPDIQLLEVVNLGVKNGNGLKKVIKTHKGFTSICRKSMIVKRNALQPISFRTLSEWKQSKREYQKLKSNIKKALGNWGPSTIDDVDI